MRLLLVGVHLAIFHFLCLPVIAIADTNSELMPKGMWRDDATGLIWDRCSAGQTWDGMTCLGKATIVQESQAKSLAKSVSTGGFSDWRLPTLAELYTIRRCSTGYSSDVREIKPHQGTFTVSWQCNPGSKSPTIDSTIFPNTPREDFWAGNPPNTLGEEGVVRFFFPNSYPRGANYVRAVRSPSEVESKVLASIFEEQLRPAMQAQLENQRRKAEEERRNAEKLRIENEELERRQQAEARAFSSILNHRDPQAMYLAAGRYDRAGEGAKARQVYDAIIERFPSSPFAVKRTTNFCRRIERKQLKTNHVVHPVKQADAHISSVRLRKALVILAAVRIVYVTAIAFFAETVT